MPLAALAGKAAADAAGSAARCARGKSRGLCPRTPGSVCWGAPGGVSPPAFPGAAGTGLPRERSERQFQRNVPLSSHAMKDYPEGNPQTGRVTVTHVPKPWGHEVIWARTDQYVGKILHVKAGQALSVEQAVAEALA